MGKAGSANRARGRSSASRTTHDGSCSPEGGGGSTWMQCRVITCAARAALFFAAATVAPPAYATNPPVGDASSSTSATPSSSAPVEVRVVGDAVRDPVGAEGSGGRGLGDSTRAARGSRARGADVLRSQPGVAVTESGGFGAPVNGRDSGSNGRGHPRVPGRHPPERRRRRHRRPVARPALAHRPRGDLPRQRAARGRPPRARRRDLLRAAPADEGHGRRRLLRRLVGREQGVGIRGHARRGP